MVLVQMCIWVTKDLVKRIQMKLSSTFDSVLFDDGSLIQTPGVIPSRIALIDSFYALLWHT
jgi:hypothetical protein